MYCYNEDDWDGKVWKEEKITSCLDSFCEIVSFSRYKNYFAVAYENEYQTVGEGQWVQFYTKEEVAGLITELRILHSLMEDTDKRPDACEDVCKDFEFEDEESPDK